jgi:Astacin (Peptidase family M12A)/Divergent InlB B-repeat domain
MAIRDSASQSGRFNPRVLLAFTLYSGGVFLALLSFAAGPPSGHRLAPDNKSHPSAIEQQVQGLYRGMPVTYVVRNGKAIFQGDIILESAGIDSVSVAYNQYLWPKVGNQYQIPYIITSGSGNLTNLNNAISRFNSTFSNIQFVARTTQTDYVNFYFNPSDNSAQCEATVGRAGGQQQIGGSGGSSNPCIVATILHEMGHTIGLWHEQSRADRNTYISVNYGNLIKGSISNFNQIFDNAQTPTLFDYASIMEYPAFSFSRNGGPAIESIPAGIPLSNPTGYTAADIDGIERLYSNAPTAITVTSNPPGLEVIVDSVTVTTPQVFNWALNSTHTLNIPAGVQSQSGNIANSTTATTFYYTYGRWNDSTASSHTITVLSGNGKPATPATSPAVTTYSANFIQLVPYAAAVFPSGTGTVTPSPAPQSHPGSGLVFYTARQQATLTATPNSGQNFYEFNNTPFWLPGGLGANPKTFYVPDTGLAVSTTVEFSPNPVYTVNVAPDPFSSNLYIHADGGFSYAPKNFSVFYDSTWTSGSTHTLSVDNPEEPYSFNSRYAFNNWSDGGAISHSVVLPSTSTTYTANLTPQFFVTDYVNETCAGSINVSPASPTGDGFYPSGAVLTFSETPNSGWFFTGWQYDLSGTSASRPLTVTDEMLVTADYNTVATALTLTSLSPAVTAPWSSGFTLSLNGTGFTPSSVVSVNGAFPTVQFVNSTQLRVNVTAAQIAKPGAFQVWVENFPSGATCAAFAALPFTVADNPIVVSRMTHGSAGTFDVNLPLTGTRGVECRSGGANGNYTMVFQFANSLTSVGGASVTIGTGSVSNSGIGLNNHEYVVNLTGVANAQYITVSLTNVQDSAGNSGNVAGPQVGVLIGDTTANGVVNSSDIAQTQSQSGLGVTSNNFREDVTVNGAINSSDIALVQSKSGTGLPSLP